MGKPAARVGDMHTCPMVNGVVPHVGGPILPPGCINVLIGGMPAARVGDMAVCVGPPDVIAMGSPTVLIGGMMAARMGDLTAHGGVITIGMPTVLIGEVGVAPPVVIAPLVPGAPEVSVPAAPAAARAESGFNPVPDHPGSVPPEVPEFRDSSEGGAALNAEPEEESTDEATPVEKKAKSFVHVRLLDHDGKPVANAKYKITLPNDEVRTGALNGQGEVKIAGIDEGTCHVSFPDYDEASWTPKEG